MIKSLLFLIQIRYDNFFAKRRIKAMKLELADLQWELFVAKNVATSKDISGMVERIKQLQKCIALEQAFILKL